MGIQTSLCNGQSSFCQDTSLMTGFTTEQNPVRYSCKGLVVKHQQNFKELKLIDLKNNIINTTSDQDLINHQAWNYIFSKFNQYYLDQNEKEEFFNILKFYHQSTSLTKASNLSYTDLKLCEHIGRRFQLLENRIYFKQKYCLQYCKFMTQNSYGTQFNKLNFDMNTNQIKDLAAKVRNFCNHNIYAFAFISHYFQIAFEKFFKENSNLSIVDRLNQLECNYQSQMSSLEKLYPASDATFSTFLAPSVNANYAYKFDICRFQKGQNSNYDQLVNFIIQKSQGAKKDLDDFVHTLMDICYERGYGFKYGVKIQDSSSKSSIQRTIEKLLTKRQIQNNFTRQQKDLYPKFEQKMKASGRNSISLKDFVEEQKSIVKEKIRQIMEMQSEIEFKIKDLVRGKCTFAKVQDIMPTAKKITETVSVKGWKVVELKNRLSEKTKDVTLIIKLPNSIAELQLVFKLDVNANEFNHKIYQLLRSELYTPITNLFVQNEQLSNKFFSEQMDIFYEANKTSPKLNLKEEFTFSSLRNDVNDFNEKFIKNTGILLEKNIQILNKKRTNLLSKFDEFSKMRQSNIKQARNFQNSDDIDRKIARRQYETSVYIGFYDYDKAIERYKNSEGLEGFGGKSKINYNLIKGEVLREKMYFSECENCYQKIIGDYYDMQDEKQRLILADICKGVGRLYLKFGHLYYAQLAFRRGLQLIGQNPREPNDIFENHLYAAQAYQKMKNFKQASNRYQLAKHYAQKKFGKESVEMIAVYNSIGKMKIESADFSSAEEILQQSISLCSKLIGKQSLEIGKVYQLLGELYCLKGDHKKSLDCYQKALEIISKFFDSECYEKAQIYSGMGQVYQAMKDYKKALELYNKRIELQNMSFGTNSESTAHTYALMAKLHKDMGQIHQAIEYARKSLDINEKLFGKNGVIYYQSAVLMAQLMILDGKKDAWIEYENVLQLYNAQPKITEKFKNPKKYDDSENVFCPKPHIQKQITSTGFQRPLRTEKAL